MLEGSMSAPLSLWAAVNSWLTPTVLFVFLNLTIGTILFTSRPSNNNKDDARSPSVLHRIKSVSFYAHRSQEPEKLPESDTHLGLPPQQTPAATEQIDSRPLFQVQPPLSRSPLMLQRLRSINLQNYFSQEPTSPVKPGSVPGESPETNNAHSESNKENELEQEAGEVQTMDEKQTLEEIYSQFQATTHFSRTKSDTEPTAGEIPTKLPRKMKKSASSKSAFAHFEEEDIVEIRRPATVREGGTVKESADLDEEVDARADDFIYRFKEQLKLQRIDSIIRYKEMIGRGSGNLENCTALE